MNNDPTESLFGDEATVQARPVVPLADIPEEVTVVAKGRLVSPDAAAHPAPRLSWQLGLILVSVLVGGVIGGAGLYLYQSRSQVPVVSPAAPAESLPAVPNAEPTPQQAEAPVAAAPQVEEPATTPAAPVPTPENVPAAEVAPKRGKKGARDEALDRRATSRPNDSNPRTRQPEARRVNTIFDRPRRAERRARRDDDADRLRRIFEGTPE